MTPKSQRKTWFNKYRDPELTGDQEAITPEGYQQLCEALGYNIEGIEALVTLWKLGAKDLGTVQYADWEQGLSDMGVTSAAGLKKSVNHIVASFPSDAKSYRAFYRKVFDFLKGERQRTADVEYVKAVLPVVASGNWLIERFVEFLDDNGEKIKSISRDQWQLLPDLSVSIRSASDLDSYSTDDAWPRLYDDFVKWMKSRS
ncbi:Cullin binding-domain-containing protein [Coemansia spiralis]|nr:Cullin binding-domain-containing protein [Coemansia spiralis]